MDMFIKECLDIAAEKFSAFGFKEAQIEQLLASGKRDLEKEIGKLKELLEESTPDIEEVNRSLHAIKGLLYNMGNTDAGDKMAELKSDDNTQGQIEKIRKTLQL